MHKFSPFSASAALIAVLVATGPAYGIKAYTTDAQEVTLRSAPRNDSKAISTIPPASAVELVNPNSWSHVRYTRPEGDVKDGWMPSKFLGARPPDSAVAKELGAENAALKEFATGLEQDKSSLAQRERELTDKLTKLNAAYEELKSGSGNYLKLKAEYDSARVSLTSAQENIQTLIQENENLKLTQRIQYFVAGAAVLLAGWLLGWLTTRRQKKKKQSYFF
ncbi:MAG: TIGR04211 family SH3 domain-containing protein [Syntrophobacter sp.]